jgi:MRG-binding protein
MAGLVGGDSDSSALTLESGDEGLPPTPRESVVTGTDGGTDFVEEDVEMREPSPGKHYCTSTSQIVFSEFGV